MPTSIETDSLPDFTQIITIPNCDFTSVTNDDPMPLLYAEKDLVVDSVVIGFQSAPTNNDTIVRLHNSLVPNQTDSVSFRLCGFDVGQNVALSYVFETTTNSFKLYDQTTTSGRIDITSSMITTAGNTRLSNTLNLVPKGNWVSLSITSAGGFSGTLKMTVQLRIRTRIN